MTALNSIEARVAREKESHDSDDVLARSYALKDKFFHVWDVTERVRKAEDALLASARDKQVLDYGCGRGEYALKLLEFGASVSGIDISENYVRLCEKACAEHGYDESRYNFQVMDAHKLTFADNSFDYVVGNGILHHLDFKVAMKEIFRVLKPGGRAVFQEPLAGNPLLGLLRRLTPRARTTDERPFTAEDLKEIGTDWNVESSYFGMLSAPVACATSVVLRPWPKNPLLGMATSIEKMVNARAMMPSWNQYVLFNLVKPSA
ncbi:MAG: class I SAM-dependent methyltransferase [Pseudomonadota bacterium]